LKEGWRTKKTADMEAYRQNFPANVSENDFGTIIAHKTGKTINRKQ
jgi:hypothetical protein